MTDSPEELKKTVRTYLLICGLLFVGTILTVLVATIPAFDIGKHGFDKADCILGLFIASIKASLVALIFMHLNHEKKAIYWLFGASFVTVFSLAAFTALAYWDPIVDTFFYSGR